MNSLKKEMRLYYQQLDSKNKMKKREKKELQIGELNMKAYSFHIDQYFPVCGKGLGKPMIRKLPPVTAHQS